MTVLLDEYEENLVPLPLRKELEAKHDWNMTSSTHAHAMSRLCELLTRVTNNSQCLVQ